MKHATGVGSYGRAGDRDRAIGMRRHAWSACVGLLLHLVVAWPATAPADEFDGVEIHAVPLRGGLHMLLGRGGNLLVCTGPDGVLVIDDQYAPLAPRILAAIAAIDPGPIRWVVNTHWHSDHTGGNAPMRETGAVVVAHDRVRERMSTDQFVEALGRRVPAALPDALPTVTFSESLRFHFNGDEIRVVHVPRAHTDGDAMIHFVRADVLHTGDAFVSGMYPFIDGSSGGSLTGLISAVDRMLGVVGADTMVVPGHGPLSGRDELIAYRTMLVDVRDRLSAAIAEGRSRAEVVASRPTAHLDDVYGAGFMKPDRFVELAYDSLARPEVP